MKVSLKCLFGHKWLYKDYTYAIKSNGKPYNFKAVRKCARCETREYKYDEWKDEMYIDLKDREDIFF